MRRITVRLGAVLAAVVAAMSTIGAPAGAATGELSASCDTKLYVDGQLRSALTVRGAYRLLGSVPATSPTTAPLTAQEWGVSVRLDVGVLGPELAAHGVTSFTSGSVLAAYVWTYQDGVQDWPQNPGGSLGQDIGVDQLGSGVTGPTAAAQLYPGNALPGHWRFESYGDVWLNFQNFPAQQNRMSVHCTADPGQDLFWGETVVA